MPKPRFTILGSSSGHAQPDRATSGYVLTVNRRHSLIDCGGGVTASFIRRGFDVLDVDRIFITHTHPDHCCELPLFLQQIHLLGREEPVEIYLPDEYVEPFKTTLNAMYIMPEKLNFTPELIGYDSSLRLDDGYTIEAFDSEHLAHNRELIDKLGLPNKCQCFSLKIKVGDRCLFYSSDIKSFDDIRPHIIDCDFIVMETTHIDLYRLIDYALTVPNSRFILTHLSDPENNAEMAAQLREAEMTNFVLAVDGLEIPLD